MKIVSFALTLTCLCLLLTSCDSLPPLAPGMSRIVIETTSFGNEHNYDAVPLGGTQPVAGAKVAGWLFWTKIYLDVFAPSPMTYILRVDSNPYKTISFNGPGETKTISYYDIIIKFGRNL